MHSNHNKISAVLHAVLGRLDSIPHDDPGLKPDNWCLKQPCMTVSVLGRQWVISQPLSSFWVYLLGVFTMGVGLHFLHTQHGAYSRLWWGISLVLWGVGALLAGTSYQAFGYEIKCAGRQTCRWTSWWEVVYLMYQQVSINAMLIAVAYSCTAGPFRIVLLRYALLSSVLYVSLVSVGGMLPVKHLITFEFMLWFSSPVFFFFCCFSAWRYVLTTNPMDLVLLGSWLILSGTLAAYWVYGKLGITKRLWAKGIWFSDNDVLHVLLILWMIYIAAVVADRIEDYRMLPFPG
jgi:hypothetical protein